MRSSAPARSPISSSRATPVRRARSPLAIASAAARRRPSGRTTQTATATPTAAATASASAISRRASRAIASSGAYASTSGCWTMTPQRVPATGVKAASVCRPLPLTFSIAPRWPR
jgi:hypothetical protein